MARVGQKQLRARGGKGRVLSDSASAASTKRRTPAPPPAHPGYRLVTHKLTHPCSRYPTTARTLSYLQHPGHVLLRRLQHPCRQTALRRAHVQRNLQHSKRRAAGLLRTSRWITANFGQRTRHISYLPASAVTGMSASDTGALYCSVPYPPPPARHTFHRVAVTSYIAYCVDGPAARTSGARVLSAAPATASSRPAGGSRHSWKHTWGRSSRKRKPMRND